MDISLVLGKEDNQIQSVHMYSSLLLAIAATHHPDYSLAAPLFVDVVFAAALVRQLPSRRSM